MAITFFCVIIDNNSQFQVQSLKLSPTKKTLPARPSSKFINQLKQDYICRWFIDSILCVIKQLMSKQTGNTRWLKDFQPLQRIGQGSFSTVYKVRRIIDGRLYALKKVKLAPLSAKQRDNALNEVRILASIRSPLVLEYREAFFDEGGAFLCIVMEWADGGDLQQLVRRHAQQPASPLPEEQVWRAAINVLEGLALLHQRGILHRDLKTANVFLCGDAFKIGDMNVSKIQEEELELAFTQTGTPYYASPQIWRDEPYGPKADIWSYGCLLYEMCAFRPPFEGTDMETLYKSIRKGKYPPLPSPYSQQLSDFIALCLVRKVDDRPSAQKLLSLRVISIKSEQYGIPRSQNCHFKLLKAIKFEDGGSPSLPASCYESHSKKKHETEETLARSDERLTLPFISAEKDRYLPKKLSIKLKNRLTPNSGDRIITLPSQRDSRDMQKAHSQKSLGGRNQSNSQSHGRIDRLPALQLDQRSKMRHLSTERREQVGSPCRKQLDIIRQLRRKCQISKNKLKKVNSSAECKPLKTEESGSREALAFASHIRKMSKKNLKKHSCEDVKAEYRSELSHHLQLQIENHRSIHLKKKGKSYKSKVFI